MCRPSSVSRALWVLRVFGYRGLRLRVCRFVLRAPNITPKPPDLVADTQIEILWELRAQGLGARGTERRINPHGFGGVIKLA